ncbi:bifunctional YncE family protein/alkaline phosphatase family protein [Paenibacillus filicis]|uniref:Bifunctional YncE family protein/alkaline phosphatase family protein n=1 Tax=Paenibacillus gyeongsangnamensis TaxID=3388067 RepID=A0ABT4QAG3_9BACL|nr:bifunctional YncE family protein/alkaline phosphatase family protein [Paenibacillus filicis]MCZ8513882.1 bifunctional YncE family protein/alkaline phosphatase family protein [Paenibacillus filicis]
MKTVKVSKKLIATTLATLLLGSSTAFAAYNVVAGPQANGTGVTPHGWLLTPAGKQLNLGHKPWGGAISPDHRYLVVSNGEEPWGSVKSRQSLQVVDIEQQKVVSEVIPSEGLSLWLGVAFSPDGKTLYASASGNKIAVYHFDNGILTEKPSIIMNDVNNPNNKFSPAGISVSPDSKFLYVANNLDNSVSRVDLTLGQVTAIKSVGKNPYTAFLSHNGSKLYATNWGESSVSILDTENFTVKKTINVGLHPNAVAENPVDGFIYVSCSDSDQISVIDPNTEQVIQTISLSPYSGAPTGSQPDALTVSPDGKTLYVANAGNNDIAVVSLEDSSRAKVEGLIPTAWYPSGVFLSKDGKKLMALSAKGLGAGPHLNGTIEDLIHGSLSFVDVPSDEQLKKYTKQVEDNNKGNKAEGDGWLSKLKGNNDFPIPRFADQHSPIKHVIYVLKENKTYDQILGDLGKGNGDPNLTQYGKNITPNLHKLANQFVTLDNFYVNSQVSADGHDWLTAAKANDWKEKTYGAQDHDYDWQGVDSASYSKAGHLWNDAAISGVSFRNYGEFMFPTKDKSQWEPSDKSMGNNYDANYPGWDLNIHDLTRFNEWNTEFKQFEKNGNLPQLEMVYLPNDHTAGTSPGMPTPQAMVAENDYALGKLVDTVAQSKYWKDTAIFVVEDDAWDGFDHVDAHRTEALVISPYTQTGKVDSTLYDQTSIIRTVQLILGMKPMTQFDASAVPMLNSFTDRPNFAPYKVEEPLYPLNQMNGQNAPMADVSKQLDFSQPDTVDKDKLDRANWKATKGDQPYPGDK